MGDLKTILKHEHLCCGLSNLVPKEKIGDSGYAGEDEWLFRSNQMILMCV